MHKDTWILGTWRRDGTSRVLMQYIDFEQNFNLGPSPIQVRGTGLGKISSSVTLDPRAVLDASHP